jgi:PAS domain S-box-containing protein
MRAVLNSEAWDIVLSDYVMPGFGGLEAIALAREKDPNLPLIVVSGQIGEDTAIDAMKAGAQDYIGKGDLRRLGPAIERELLEAENRRSRKKAEDEIEKYHAHLEDLVNQRTAALSETNRALEMEIAGRRAVEQALREAEAKSSAMIKYAPTGIFEVDLRNSRLVSLNDALCTLTGYTREFLLAVNASELLDEESKKTLAERVRKHLAGEKVDGLVDYRVKKKDGSIMNVVLNVSFPRETPGIAFVVGYDVTERAKEEKERRKADERHSHLNRQLRAIRNCDQAMVRATSEKGLIDDVCRLICEETGYRMAWVGQVEHDEAKTIRPLGWGGFEDGYLQDVGITWADDERGRGPTGVAARTGKTDYFQDFAVEPRAAPWREKALARGYLSSLAIPLKDVSGEVFAVFTTYAPKPNVFNEEEIRLLEELAGDLAFGILAWRARAERARAAAILRESEEKYHNLFNNMA